MKTRAKWSGPLPEVGDFLRSPKRPRFCYEIVHVVTSSIVGDVTYATFHLLRHPIAELPPQATTHVWRWDPRTRKRGP